MSCATSRQPADGEHSFPPPPPHRSAMSFDRLPSGRRRYPSSRTHRSHPPPRCSRCSPFASDDSRSWLLLFVHRLTRIISRFASSENLMRTAREGALEPTASHSVGSVQGEQWHAPLGACPSSSKGCFTILSDFFSNYTQTHG